MWSEYFKILLCKCCQQTPSAVAQHVAQPTRSSKKCSVAERRANLANVFTCVGLGQHVGFNWSVLWGDSCALLSNSSRIVSVSLKSGVTLPKSLYKCGPQCADRTDMDREAPVAFPLWWTNKWMIDRVRGRKNVDTQNKTNKQNSCKLWTELKKTACFCQRFPTFVRFPIS